MPPKILTVDDDQTIRRCVAASFQSFECDILEAADGLEGLATAQRERPDVILLDYVMPIMDGSEMLAKMRVDTSLRSIPVIMVTAEATRERVMKLLRHGVTDYLLKPFRKDQLIERVGKIVDLKNGSRGDKAARRFDDPLKLLVVDDKPAIIEQIQNALVGTSWSLRSVAQPGQALDECLETLPDVILISLSLPGKAGFTLFEMFRNSLLTKNVPVLGLSVKTATQEQSRAQQLGFSGIVTKPITPPDLQARIASTLHLDASFKYFRSEAGALVLSVPAELNGPTFNDVAARVPAKLAEAVDAGLNQFILDLSQIQSGNLTLVRLGLDVMKLCQETQIPCSFVGSEALCHECESYEETRGWQFARSFEEALAKPDVQSSAA